MVTSKVRVLFLWHMLTDFIDETPRNIVTKFGILIASDNIEERIQSEKKEKREKVEKREEV